MSFLRSFAPLFLRFLSLPPFLLSPIRLFLCVSFASFDLSYLARSRSHPTSSELLHNNPRGGCSITWSMWWLTLNSRERVQLPTKLPSVLTRATHLCARAACRRHVTRNPWCMHTCVGVHACPCVSMPAAVGSVGRPVVSVATCYQQ
jgi:hypothetical protein